jgi:hypothetical protein
LKFAEKVGISVNKKQLHEVAQTSAGEHPAKSIPV